jgi:lysophospholipase L1-like esterase
MAVVENRFVCDLKRPVQAQALKGNVFSLDNLGSRLSVLIYDNGQPATISGSITANCILPDGSTVNVNGGLTTENGGSKAYVDVPQSCLLITGILKIAIKCTSSSVVTTLAAIVANVYMTKTDNVITPSQQIIDDWNAEISAALATIGTVPTGKTVVGLIDEEATLRADADNNLLSAVQTEATLRAAADSDLKSAFMQEQASLEAVPLDGYVEIEGNMSDSGTWNNIMYSFKHIVIAVKPGDVVKIKCTANTLQIGFVKSYTKPVSGAAIDYSSATGFTGKIKPTSNVLNSYTVPSDVNFLIVEKVYSEIELTFTDFTINGYDLTKSIGTHIVNIEDGIKNIPSLETEVNKIASEIIIGYGMNRYNPNDEDIIPSAYLNGAGTGMTVNGAYFTSGYCDVENFSTITVQRFNGTSGIVGVRAYEFYDDDKTYISGTAGTSITPTGIEVPSNAKYVRFSGDSGAGSYMVIPGSSNYSGFVSYKEIYSVTNQKGKTLIFNGDSIPFGYTSSGDVPYNYPKQMASCFGMKLKNYSIGGSTISEWGSGGDAPTDRNPIVDRYTEMADGDIIVIAAGTNDWNYGWCPPGEMTDRGKTTFYGALHTLCLGLLDKYPGKLIVFCTPIKRRKNNTTPMPDATNPYGKTLNEYCNIIKEVCDYYSIPVLDLYSESILNPGIDAQMNLYIPDGVHPNQDGHDIIARRVINWFKQIIY